MYVLPTDLEKLDLAHRRPSLNAYSLNDFMGFYLREERWITVGWPVRPVGGRSLSLQSWLCLLIVLTIMKDWQDDQMS